MTIHATLKTVKMNLKCIKFWTCVNKTVMKTEVKKPKKLKKEPTYLQRLFRLLYRHAKHQSEV